VKLFVLIPEVHYVRVEVEAENSDEAIEKTVRGDYQNPEAMGFSHTLLKEYWEVQTTEGDPL
jgi:hypothetical protein